MTSNLWVSNLCAPNIKTQKHVHVLCSSAVTCYPIRTRACGSYRWSHIRIIRETEKCRWPTDPDTLAYECQLEGILCISILKTGITVHIFAQV